MLNYKIYSAGGFVESAAVLEVRNPFDHSLIATTCLADEVILNKAIIAAQAVRQEMAVLPSYKRFEILRYISDQLKVNRQRLAEVLAAESAKPLRYALAEIDRSAQTFLIAAEEAKRVPKEYMSLDWTPNGTGKEGIVKYFPIGLVAGIAPFNFPMNLAVHKIAPAIASGCPIILKPASSTPLSTLELAKIIDTTELPKGAVSVLPMDRKTGNQLVTDERFALLSFTGSPVVGWEMKKQAGRKKVVLELGGNAGVIVAASADLEKTLQKSIMGAFSYSGQICIHAQRFFVHESLFKAFVEGMKAAAEKLRSGNPLLADTEISSMIDEENAKRVESWIHEAVEQGARLICGGKRQATFVEPTILVNTKDSMKVYAEEVFGPVITIEPYNSIEEAVKLANNTRFGLQCGVFTNLVSELDYCFMHLEVGGVIHNDVPTIRFDQMPYGGIKDSGLGREGVRYAMHDMLEPRILVK
ncbi:MAG: aldehyde dehydrogenase family protein [Bacteroidetes bacterium]|nr:aldehyde dehydrogenase family protein [Bacteroidota bacterium]